ncbi:hypothetical protein [Streptomyces goshikiensis]|uniref:hypothetical protein n=1 Tax=Streptomyces goshikiensis TaxID=1942 RepID=UPI00365B4ACC
MAAKSLMLAREATVWTRTLGKPATWHRCRDCWKRAGRSRSGLWRNARWTAGVVPSSGRRREESGARRWRLSGVDDAEDRGPQEGVASGEDEVGGSVGGELVDDRERLLVGDLIGDERVVAARAAHRAAVVDRPVHPLHHGGHGTVGGCPDGDSVDQVQETTAAGGGGAGEEGGRSGHRGCVGVVLEEHEGEHVAEVLIGRRVVGCSLEALGEGVEVAGVEVRRFQALLEVVVEAAAFGGAVVAGAQGVGRQHLDVGSGHGSGLLISWGSEEWLPSRRP